MNRFYIPEHCSTGLKILRITFQLRWINAGTISKEVELRDIQVISMFITMFANSNLIPGEPAGSAISVLMLPARSLLHILVEFLGAILDLQHLFIEQLAVIEGVLDLRLDVGHGDDRAAAVLE